MKHPLLCSFFILCLAPFCLAQGQPSSSVKLVRHYDGSLTVSRQLPNQKMLVKKNVGANGKVRLVSYYQMDQFGNPRSCKIYDASQKLLFKIAYAYEKSSGRLVGERMFHADKLEPNTKTPLLARETRYTYDAQGQRSKPIVYTFHKGKTAEEHFGKDAFTLPTP